MDENLRVNTKTLRKDIKRAKLFAIQHLTRRIKILRNKRGTEQQLEKNARKAMRFEDELEFIKELDINIIVNKLEDKDALTDSTMVKAETLEERAMARLISSKPIQNHLKQSIKPKAQQQQEKQDSPQLSSLPPGSSSDQENSFSDNEVQPERTTSSLFVGRLSSTLRRKPVHNTTTIKKKSLGQTENNTNVELKNKKQNKEACKKSLNRMGQRARQRLWAEQYGKKSNHIKSKDNIAKPKHNRTKACTRELTNKHKGQETKRKKTREFEAKKRNVANSYLRASAVAKRKGGVEEVASHPSWEASKRRKLQQSISLTTFQGQKITFEDSD